ncbi:hypothetical protein Z949_400 [Sulfitobacter guttiformis KCTC 32187]|nr:hypothetical protein Z949_400 [Sulfitobacter guttiformis KCTC 32187]
MSFMYLAETSGTFFTNSRYASVKLISKRDGKVHVSKVEF